MKKIALILIVSLAFFASCKKSVESEKKSWDLNLKAANELSYEFPSFSNVIKEQIKNAETVMNEALAISDEKMKIQKMSDANILLNSAFVGNLKDIKSLRQSVRSKSIEARGLKLEYNEMMSTNQAITEAERIVFDSDIKLKSIVTTKADADALSGLVESDLRTAISSLDRIISRVKERENLEKKKTEQAVAEKAAVEKKKTEAAQPIKCTYCGQLSPAGSINCKYCGAPLTK